MLAPGRENFWEQGGRRRISPSTYRINYFLPLHTTTLFNSVFLLHFFPIWCLLNLFCSLWSQKCLTDGAAVQRNTSLIFLEFQVRLWRRNWRWRGWCLADILCPSLSRRFLRLARSLRTKAPASWTCADQSLPPFPQISFGVFIQINTQQTHFNCYFLDLIQSCGQ